MKFKTAQVIPTLAILVMMAATDDTNRADRRRAARGKPAYLSVNEAAV